MAFFDDIGRKFSEAGQKTVAKTKDFMDTSRLNSMISEKEKLINNTYTQIGKLYASLHAADYEEPFAGMLHTVSEAEKSVSEYRKQIREIKGVKSCPNCGADVANEAAFCTTCGTPMPKTPESGTRCGVCGAAVQKDMRFCTVCGSPVVITPPAPKKVCPSCGREAEDGMLFCSNCGSSLAPVPAPAPVAEPAFEPVTEPAPEPVTEPIPAPKKVCPNCSMEVEDGMLFCVNCGTPVAPAPVSEKEPASEPIPVPVSKNLCPRCGAAVSADAAFCTECGTKF